MYNLKKFLGYLAMMLLPAGVGVTPANAQEADIKFDELVYDYGVFYEDSAVVSHTFTFTNVGKGPLVIHQAYASCGCTIPEFTQEPVMPGKTGAIKVTYDGTGRYPGYFKKSVTVRTNAPKAKMLRLYVEGEMKAVEKKE